MKSRLAMYHIDPSDPTTFVVGKCLIQTRCFLLLVLLTPNGRWDGFALIDSKDVVSVATEHPYLERLRKLLGLWNEVEPVWPGCLPNSILDFFETALCAQRAVSVELCASGVTDCIGFVEAVDGTFVKLRQYDDDDLPDGFTCFTLNAVTRAYLSSESLRALEYLALQEST